MRNRTISETFLADRGAFRQCVEATDPEMAASWEIARSAGVSVVPESNAIWQLRDSLAVLEHVVTLAHSEMPSWKGE